VPSQLSGPRKNKAAAASSGKPAAGSTEAQPFTVTWTTPPTGAASGHTVMDEFGRLPFLVAHPVAGVPGAGDVATGATARDGVASGDGEADGVATGALGWAVAVAVETGVAGLDAGVLDATGVFEVQAASTAVTAQAAPRIAIDLKDGILRSFV
jgi:hypothetical protein